MRKSGLCWAVFIFLAAGTLSTAHAGPNANAKILLHLLAPTTKNACGRSNATPNCSGIVTAGGLYPQAYFAYLLVTDADPAAGIAGVQCGVSYNSAPNAGVDVYSWTNCASLEFPSTGWPAAGGGNLVTWDSATKCQRFEPGGAGTGVKAVAGYFYCAAYGTDTLRVTVRPIDAAAKVSDCTAQEDTLESPLLVPQPSQLGFACFSVSGNEAGYNPCGQQGGSGLRVPEPPEEHVLSSSGYDPTQHNFDWPVRLTMGENQGLVVPGRFYGPGETVQLSFDHATLGLTADGLVIFSCAPPVPNAPQSPPDAWVSTFYKEFSRAHGTVAEKARSVLSMMDQQVLDPAFPPELSGSTLRVRFRNTPLTLRMELENRASSSSEGPPDLAARNQVRFLTGFFHARTEPAVWVRTGEASIAMRGRNALDALEIFRSSERQSLNSAHLARAKELYLTEALNSMVPATDGGDK